MWHEGQLCRELFQTPPLFSGTLLKLLKHGINSARAISDRAASCSVTEMNHFSSFINIKHIRTTRKTSFWEKLLSILHALT